MSEASGPEELELIELQGLGGLTATEMDSEYYQTESMIWTAAYKKGS